MVGINSGREKTNLKKRKEKKKQQKKKKKSHLYTQLKSHASEDIEEKSEIKGL